jgi:competence protein ComEA
MPTHGKETPLSTTPERYIGKLKRLENDAQRGHLGGWEKAGPAPVSDATAVAETPAGPTLNVNTATSGELETLPGIGPAFAQRILAARPFKDLEDMARVQGIGPATLEKLKGRVRFRD